ncbi:hypothetical protein H6F86_13620 [Phormidium sp. FACHB-592]|uniref:Uncharacterized protein n=1 Tax=Stenomitos frigidus AS-A4 TaxID=2933935 RepID=A0ABV0KU94_9CYAN|nr:hypothetical protein [Phormidium sp. FACHB-592]MBD2074915.1 hypothetical protein [Phormidium sp. FACHB-592]
MNQSVKKFREGEVPSSMCSEVNEYSYSMFDVVGEEVGEEKLERYKQILANALVFKGRTISAFLQDTSLESVADSYSLDVIPKSKLKTLEADLQVLEDAAGRFKALANSMQV